MEEGFQTFPFSKLRHDIYLTLEVMMYVERSQALEFMHAVSKEGRSYLEHQYFSVKNGFINEGLIVHDLDFSFTGFGELETLYF
jgi:hypothetical protein